MNKKEELVKKMDLVLERLDRIESRLMAGNGSLGVAPGQLIMNGVSASGGDGNRSGEDGTRGGGQEKNNAAKPRL